MSVSFAGTGDISERTTVTDMMNIDVLSSNVVGLIGSPYEIETSSSFDEATITFTIDQTKLMFSILMTGFYVGKKHI